LDIGDPFFYVSRGKTRSDGLRAAVDKLASIVRNQPTFVNFCAHFHTPPLAMHSRPSMNPA
jgi:hypothetical protein